MINQIIKIRKLQIEDLEQAAILSYSEGWNQTTDDWKLLIDNPDNICIAAEYDKKVAGTATALNHSDNVAWIGMVIVDKAFRGKGIGKLLMTSIIDELRHFRSVKLDATPAGLPLYKDLGFVEELMIDRMVCNSLSDNNIIHKNNKAEIIRNTDMDEILDFDLKVFGTSRNYLLNKLFTGFPEKAFKFKFNTNLNGYIFGRNGIRYNYIGPLSAVSYESALILLNSALDSLTDQPVVLDILQDKTPLIRYLESIGFHKQRHFTRMYLKSNDFKGIPGNYYLISGPEYG